MVIKNKMQVNEFENKYSKQINWYQQNIKNREELKQKIALEECTFTPATNHKGLGDKKTKKNEQNKSVDVVERMEKFQKSKMKRLEMKKRELTPKFKPQVLENYNSIKNKHAKKSKLRDSKSSNAFKNEYWDNQPNINNEFSSKGSVKLSWTFSAAQMRTNSSNCT